MSTTTISKAEQKRIKDATEFIHTRLKWISRQMKNDLLESVGNWAILSVQQRLQHLLDGGEPTRGWSREGAISRLKSTLERKTTLSFDAMKSEEENFDEKIARVADKMVKFGLRRRQFEIEQIHVKGGRLEFLASNQEIEVHARAIYVHGAIVAPHYRFITTKRNKK